MNRLMNKWYTWIICFGFSGAIAVAYEGDAGFTGSTYLTTEVGIKAVDNFPLPEQRDHSEIAEQEARMKANLVPLAQTFTLHSNPGATKVVYLDFDGHFGLEDGGTTYPPMNFEGSAGTFSNAELTRIQEVWQSVAEDFLPFDLDITTENPGVEALRNTGGGDTQWGLRVVVTPGPWTYSWAYVGSFNWNTDYEAQAWTGDNTMLWIADSANHEIGHALGLAHDGGGGDGEYYAGHGSGATHWSPIMGWAGYGVSQWSKGEYAGANNSEDDLAIITTQNGFGYRTDDHGSATGSATPLTINGATLEMVGDGIIERNTDVDYFSFTMASAGNVQFVVSPDDLNPNIDILAELRDSGGAVLYSSNPPAALDASFDVTLAAGDYYLSVDGTGFGNPPVDGYSDYASLGYYSIEALSSILTSVDMAEGALTAPILRFDRRPVSPFTSASSFSFALSKPLRVSAGVYDVRGRLVETLLAGELPAGAHTASWEPKSPAAFATGLYFIRIDAGGERITARLMHLP